MTGPRAQNAEVRERRRVQQLIRPFLSHLGRWNETLPHLLAMLGASRSSADRRKAAAALRDMLEEIRTARAALAAATATAARHDRVEDVRLSLHRLEARLILVAGGSDGGYWSEWAEVTEPPQLNPPAPAAESPSAAPSPTADHAPETAPRS